MRRVLDKQASMAEVAAAQVSALETQIRAVGLQRAVLPAAAARGANAEEMTLMNPLARLSAQERRQVIDEVLAEVLGGSTPPGWRPICG